MFDEPTPPSNLPTGQSGKEPEDIFAAVEPSRTPSPPSPSPPGLPPRQLTPVSAAPLTAPAPAPAAEVKKPIIASRTVVMVVGVVVGLFVLAGIAWGILKFVKRAAMLPSAAPAAESPTAEPAVATPEIPALPGAPTEGLPGEETPTPAVAVETDSDGDGLTDAQETTSGTNPQSSDSDNDGLLDGEEVQTYQTDPLNADTDGDTYLDGQEVRSGYNPKGTGRLFTVPAQ